MQFAAALVEHLIVGIIALIWMLPLLDGLQLMPAADFEKHKDFMIAIGLPITYVVGIYVDVFASVLTAWMRSILERQFGADRFRTVFGGVADGKSAKPYAKTVKILRRAPDEAVKFLQLLTSREKACRGVFLCLLLGAATNVLVESKRFRVSPTVLLILAVVSFVVWLRLTVLTEVFKEQLAMDA